MKKMGELCESKFTPPIIMLVALIFSLIGITVVSVAIIALALSMSFIFAEKKNNLFVYILAVPYFLSDVVSSSTPLIVYFCMIGVVVLALIYFIVKVIIDGKNGRKYEKGKFFWGLIISSVAFLIGGLIGNFKLKVFGIIFLTNLAIIILYLIAVNFTENFKRSFFLSLIEVAVIASISLLVEYFKTGDVLGAFINHTVNWVCANHINTVAVSISFGIIGCLFFGYKTDKDWLFLVFASILFAVEILTVCRIMLLLSGLAFLTLLIITIINSGNKKRIIITLAAILVVAAAVFAMFYLTGTNLLEPFITKMESGEGSGLNGRQKVWPWGIDHFKKYPVFGVGFLSEEIIPGYRETFGESIVAMHNTPLQWLTSLGIVGTLLMLAYYVIKYIILFKGGIKDKLFIIVSVIMLALDGAVDTNASIEFLFIIVITLFVVCAEKDNENLEKEKNKKIKE